MFSNFSYELKCLLKEANKQKEILKHNYVGTEHFILSVLKKGNDLKKILNKYGLTYELFKEKLIEKVGIGSKQDKLFVLTPLFRKVLENTIIVSNELKKVEVDSKLVLNEMLEIGEGLAFRIICELGIDIDKLSEKINIETKTINSSFINNIGVDLTDKAKNGLIDSVIGRGREIKNVIEILLRKNKRNPILVGPAGVGKTAIIESLAYNIVNENVPPKMLNKKIIMLSIASLVAGTKYRGEFEEKLLNIIKELEKNNNYILFIDEIHTIMGAGGAEGAIDASNILKPAMSRDRITIIGATTTEEYKKYIEDDKAFSRRFQKVIVNEPNKKELFSILEKTKEIYEKHHNVIIDNKLIKYIINVSQKYLKNKKEPDRSIDIIDEVSSMVSTKTDADELNEKQLKNKLNKLNETKKNMINNNNYEEALKIRQKERKIESIINNKSFKRNEKIARKITKEDINEYLFDKYNFIPFNCKTVKNVIQKQKKELIKKYPFYNKELNIIMFIIKNQFSVEKKKNKPTSLFLNGCDTLFKKTIVDSISFSLFNSNVINVDLNEFLDEQSIYKMIGSPPGYIGYNDKQTVFESLRDYPFYVIQFLNYNNAHFKVKELIKEIVSKGYINDSSGHKIDFLNSLIIFNDLESSKKKIGFNNFFKTSSNNINEYVFKTINFNKIKTSVI